MTDSHYKKLAQERTVFLALIGLVKEFLLPPEGDEDPQRRLECEELVRSESQVPEDMVIDVVFKLQRRAKVLELEMSKYKHVLAENNDEQEWAEESTEAGAGQKKAGAPAGQGKGKGGGGSPQAANAQRGRPKPPHPAAHQAGVPAGRRT